MSPTEPFPSSDFDDWAETYDVSVSIDQFPFYRYETFLDKVVALADAKPGLSVLDLGTGTGNLALRLASLGCDLWCTDFSAPMLEKARQKLPGLLSEVFVSLLSQRYSDPHGCSLPGCAFCSDCPAVGFHQVPGDCQPQPHTTRVG